MLFRRKFGTPVWHWSSRCAQWPAAALAEEMRSPPGSGVFCAECQKKEPREADSEQAKGFERGKGFERR